MNEVGESKFNELANEYRDKKQKTLFNLLFCGKILHDVKLSLPHGTWLTFLGDVRVSESERTAQRLVSIYRNYRHLVDEDKFKKTDALTQLGVSHLLELQKLPDRFKKEIEVVKEKDGEKVQELVKVIDEERLSDFLDQRVEFEGKTTPVRELPLKEMKKYIKEAQGVYEPDEYDYDEKTEENSNNNSEENSEGDHVLGVMCTDKNPADNVGEGDDVSEALSGLANFLSLGSEVLPKVQKIDLSSIALAKEKHVEELKQEVKKTISHCEAMIVACMNIKEKL